MKPRLINYTTNKMIEGRSYVRWKTDYDEIEMSRRLRNILRRNGFESLEGLREYPKEHFIKFRNMWPTILQELYKICDEQGIKLRSVEDLNDREHRVRFDDFLCMRLEWKNEDDLRRYRNWQFYIFVFLKIYNSNKMTEINKNVIQLFFYKLCISTVELIMNIRIFFI